MPAEGDLEIQAATAERWADVERLAGERGFYSGCWCMWWRVSAVEFRDRPASERRTSLRKLVAGSPAPGLVAYLDGEPVGWVAVAPRHEYHRLNRSTKLKPVDDQPVWVVTCFYIDRRYRRRGVAEALLAGAIEHAHAHGAEAVEGIPIDTAGRSHPGASLYTGTLPMFDRAGFVEITRRGGRPIVRRPTGNTP